jgi:recombination protein RecR
MNLPSTILQEAVEKLSIFPGVGKRSALRMVIYLLQQPDENVFAIGKALDKLKTQIKQCATCFNVSEESQCSICQNPLRDQQIICVVENFTDILAIEATGLYKGLYHVLGGLISPMDGIGAEELNISSLINRTEEGSIKEIIFALSATMEGDTTAFYLKRKIQQDQLIFSQISRGVSLNSELEYIDEHTLANSIENRVPYKA